MTDASENFGDFLQGEPGELIDRLIALLDDDPDADPHWWSNFGTFVVLDVGGVSRVPSDGREPFKPGTLGAIRAQRYGTASRREYMDLIRTRLSELVRVGLSEGFLVRALRDDLLRVAAAFAATEGVDELRAEMREDLRAKADDPQAIAEFRDSMAEHDPEAAELSDEDVRQRLLDMAARSLLDPLAPEEVVDKWAMKDRMERRAAELLSDRFVDDWARRQAWRSQEDD